MFIIAKDIKGSFYQKRVTKTRTRYLDIKQVRAVLGDRLSQALLGFHAFTGCDSVSAFSGRGKTGPLKQLRKDKQAMGTFINLGKSWDVTQLVNDTLQAFTCHMYASSSKITKVNVLRHEMFLPREVKLIPALSHLVRTVFSSTFNEQITKQEYGRGLCNETLMCQNPLVMVG